MRQLQNLRRLVFTTAVAAALIAPVAQATSSDDRSLYRGTSPTLAPSTPGADDRGQFRGTSPVLAPTSASPDDRPLARSIREPQPFATVVRVVEPRGFDWTDALIGAGFAAALALVGGTALLLGRQSRRQGAQTPITG